MRSKESLLRLHRFRFDEKRRQVGEVEMMVSDFARKQEQLDLQIEAEEQRSGISDPDHFNYSMTAKSLRQRRENIGQSIDDLKGQLALLEAAAAEEEAELKKVELLVDKEGGTQVSNSSNTLGETFSEQMSQ